MRYEWPIDDSPIGIDDHAKLVLRHADAAHEHHPYNVEVLVNYQYWDRRVSDEDIWWQHIIQRMDKVGIDIQFFFPSALNGNNRAFLDPDSGKLVVSTEPNSGGRQYSNEIREVSAATLDAITGGKPPAWTSGHAYFGAAQIGHLGGTLRMGSEGSGVVDEAQRFLSYDNLYVADLSVFPSILAAKPSLTLAALSLRLADTIVDQLPLPSGDVVRRGVKSRATRLEARSDLD